MKFTDLRATFCARFLIEDGQTMAEYGVVLSVITVAVVVVLASLSGGITNLINNVTAVIP
jgi:Flp pilus assembly pilin Flp